MVENRNFMGEARRALEDEELEPRARLEKSAMLFWQAYVHQGGHWAAELQKQADAILLRMLGESRRIKKTIAAMDDRGVDELCRALMGFAERMEKP